ncbi:hypothetical protein ACOSQ2_007205 [Xanthoceras sorbifolium]
MILWFLWSDRNCFIHGRPLKPVEVLLDSAAGFLSEFHNTISAVSIMQRVSQQSPSVADLFSVAVGEALALREGLLFVQSLSLFVEWIESDAISVVNAILDMEAYLSFDGLVINDVKALCKSVGVIHCQAISRKRNGLPIP